MSVALSFVTSPPGFAPLVDFTLHAVAGAQGLYSLHADQNPATRLFILDAAVYLPEYAPVISDEQRAALDLNVADDALVLVVANPGENGTTVNLMAPIVVNASTGVCAQVILDGQDWSLQSELGARAA